MRRRKREEKRDMLICLVGGGVRPVLDVHEDHNGFFFPNFPQAAQARI